MNLDTRDRYETYLKYVVAEFADITYINQAGINGEMLISDI
ncbi:phenolic acid decarboxylase [Bacillus sp. NPDC077027]